MEKEKTKQGSPRVSGPPVSLRWGLLIGVTLVLALSLYPSHLITRPSYELGDVAERDIKAPKDLLIEDKKATIEYQQRAVANILTVYDHDTGMLDRVSKRVESSFEMIRDLVETERSIQSASGGDATTELEKDTALLDMLWESKPDFEQMLGIPVSKSEYRILEKEGFSPQITGLINRILSEILENGVVANKEILLRESDRGITLRDLTSREEQDTRSLRQYYGVDQAKTMVRIVTEPLVQEVNHTVVALVVDFSQRLIQPNITLNRSETEERKKLAADQVKPIFYQIKANEMLLREGEKVTEKHLFKLKALEGQINKEHVLARGMGSGIIIFCLLATGYLLHLKNAPPGRHNSKNLIFLASVLVFFFFLAQISASLGENLSQNTSYHIPSSAFSYGTPLAAAAMLICLFMGIEVAVPFALLMAVLSAIIFENRLEFFVYFLVSSTMAAYWVRNLRERKAFMIAGLKLGLLNMLIATAVDIYAAQYGGFHILYNWIFAFMGGIGAAIITVGVAPLVEIGFGFTTDITLLELANLDRPILRRLMIEAPGTYHHSVIVGTLVEAAASEIGANPLLAKVCGYYHDIGKMKKPPYFIENQLNGKNPHDKLAPSMSALILIAHVKNGVEIARENKLGQIIIDTIRQHHGTSLISFFYEKAKQLKGEDAVNIDDFRYPGERPQTKEAGLVMLADIVEAASRTLNNPTPSRIQGLVQNLINKVFSDGQLDQCELTLKDLHRIANSFNKILNGIHHHRIDYPAESLTLINGKNKNGSSDRQSTKPAQDSPGEDPTKGKSRLKRLGQS